MKRKIQEHPKGAAAGTRDRGVEYIFTKWLEENSTRFRHPPTKVDLPEKSKPVWQFSGVTGQLQIRITIQSLSVACTYDGRLFGYLFRQKLHPRKPGPNQFEPLITWANKNLEKNKFLGFYGNPPKTTASAKIESLEALLSTRNIVRISPVVMRPDIKPSGALGLLSNLIVTGPKGRKRRLYVI